MTAERALLTVGTKQVKVGREILATPIMELEVEVTAEKRDGEIGVVVWAMQSFKSSVAADEDTVNSAERRAWGIETKHPRLGNLSNGCIGPLVASICALLSS